MRRPLSLSAAGLIAGSANAGAAVAASGARASCRGAPGATAVRARTSADGSGVGGVGGASRGVEPGVLCGVALSEADERSALWASYGGTVERGRLGSAGATRTPCAASSGSEHDE